MSCRRVQLTGVGPYHLGTETRTANYTGIYERVGFSSEEAVLLSHIILKIKHMLRRYNLQWEMPTKTFPTQRAIAWLKKLALPEIDRWEMDHLLADLEHAQRRVVELEKVIAQRSATSGAAALLATTPGVGAYTAIALACRVGRVERFPVRTA